MKNPYFLAKSQPYCILNLCQKLFSRPKLFQIVRLIHCLIHIHFSEGTFSLLSKIELLDFSHNSIMKIDDNTLAGMDVKKLDLSHNNLRKVPTLSLQKLTKVSKLLLDDNLYRTLESHAIHRIKGRASN